MLLVGVQVGGLGASAHYLGTNKGGGPVLEVRTCTDFVSFDLFLLQPSRLNLHRS